MADTSTKCSSGLPRSDTSWSAITHAHGAGNSNEIASFVPNENDITSQGLVMRCDAIKTSTDNYSCGSLKGISPAAKPFNWYPTAGDFVLQFQVQLPPNEGNMDPGIWATGQNYAWENDFPEWWGMNHLPTTANTWCNDGMGFSAVPVDSGGSTGGASPFFCQSPGMNFDPSAAMHTYTMVMNGNGSGQNDTGYVDGVQVTSQNYPSFSNAVGKLILQNDMRLDRQTSQNPDPHFPAAGNSVVLRYIVMYQPASQNNAGSNAPLIVPGTTVN